MPRRSQHNTGRVIRDPGSTKRHIYRPPGSPEDDEFIATHTAPVPANSPIIARWSTLALEIIDNLDSRHIDWAAVECFQRLYKDPIYNTLNGVTTVIITARNTLPHSNDIAEMMGEVCRMSGCRVELQFCSPNLIDMAQQTETVLSLPEVGYPSMGSRVSVRMDLETPTEATVGGILRLVTKDTKKEEYFALTCFHNIPTFQSYRSNYIDLEPGVPHKPVQIYGSVTCAFPSQLLQAEVVSDIAADINRMNKKIELLKKGFNQVDREEESGCLQNELEWYEAELRQLKEKYASLHSIDSNIGFVSATSGLPVHNGKHLDWALIALSGLDAPPQSVNMTYNVQERTEIAVRLSQWSSNLEGGAKVYKPGSTRVTEGIVNSVPSYVRFRETEHSLPVAREWAVIPVAKYKSFSDPGDSGAWVVDHLTNHVVGMILARNGGLGVSYVTPIREIINHIEYFTNKVVDLPIRI
ncbi:hypothetical protein PISL3812_09063 [Talaromyces islandicus]|uniref:Uncharacterized protein n=1 Tax=Talaromyces islandicus TaxID=28573 RepID=A0A0U1M8V7_TALIS|nr:hypothetical protein PISL3812_09063 [Talaromyces islandicus]